MPSHRDRNLVFSYKSKRALWGDDFSYFGFDWVDCDDNRHSVISFMRRESTTGHWVVVVANFTPQSHSHHSIGVPLSGFYSEVFNTNSERYRGSSLGDLGGKTTEEWGIDGYEHSLDVLLPPILVLVFSRDEQRGQAGQSDTLNPLASVKWGSAGVSFVCGGESKTALKQKQGRIWSPCSPR